MDDFSSIRSHSYEKTFAHITDSVKPENATSDLNVNVLSLQSVSNDVLGKVYYGQVSFGENIIIDKHSFN